MKKKGQYIYFILFFIGSFQICGQTIDYKKEASEENSNFYEIVKKTRKEFTNTKKSAKSSNSRVQSKAEKQFERWVWIWKDKVNLDGSFPKNNIDKEEYLKLLTHSSNTLARVDAPTTKTWQQIGPIVTPEVNGYAAYPGMGRINVVAVDKNNAQIMYAGAAAGGVWKTTNGGTTWIPKTDNLAGLGVTDIIIDPNNSSTLYMATGDEDAKHISSIGVFKSTDAGDTWSATGLTFSLNENEYVRDLSFAPGSSTVIFALTNNEVKKSIDSGATWINKPAGNYTSDRFQSIIFDPNDATKVIVSDAYSTLYYSSDSGETFSEHPVYTGVSPKNLKLTTSANDTDHFYGLQQDIRDNSGTITTEAKFIKFRFDNDDTVNDKISETSITGFNSQGGYNQCLAVSPTDKNSIILAGVRGYKSTDNGATFSVYLNPYNNPPGVGFYVHPDHHHLSFLPDGVTVINGHDGGIHKGLISATTGWTDLSNGLLITQPYNISITQGINGDDYMMGNQDNDGFSKVYQTDTNKWVSCLAGDGTATGIDISNSDIRYLGGTYGALYRSDNGYANGYNQHITLLGNDDDAAFVSPLSLHPTIAATIYAGHSDVKKSVDRGANWTSLSSGLIETEFLDVSLNDNSSTVRIFAIGQSGGNSTLKRSVDDGVNWTTIASPTGVAINSVYGVPNTNVVYATVSSYTAGKKVYKSTDNGSSWIDISGDLPNIIMYKIILDPNKSNETIYLATELGLYFTDNTTSNWKKLGTGLPNVRISDIEISKNNGNIYLGTFGRGLWVYNDQKYFDNVTDNNWSTADNWEGETLPTATDDVFLKDSESVTLNTNATTVKSLEIEEGALLTIDNNRDLTIENNFSSNSVNSVVKINSDVNDSGVLIVNGTATAKVEFERGGLKLDKWSLVSVPLEGQKIKNFAVDVNNDIRVNTTPTPNRYAVGYYNDANGVGDKWVYYDADIDVNTTFTKNKGYVVSRNTDGAVRFVGTLLTDNQLVSVTADEWNAIGNPYTAYYPANKNSDVSFINENTTNLDSPAIYIWDVIQNKYVAITDLVSSTQTGIPPGQGFFVKTKAGVTNLTFNKSNRLTKPATGDNIFNKTENSTPYIELFAKTGNIEVSTSIIYSETATLGFDANEDILNFDSSDFDINTQLLAQNIGKNYTIQSIPNNDFENQVIPISLRAKANEELVLRALSKDFSEDVNVYLEDRNTNTFVKLDEASSFKITTTEDISNIGRFYLHLSRTSLAVEGIKNNSIKVFNLNRNLYVKGLNEGGVTVLLFDITGKQVLRSTQKGNGNNNFNLGDLNTGVYLIKVNLEQGSISKKIIIK